MKTLLLFAFASVASIVCAGTQVAAEQSNEVILASQIKWEPLNPARGDKSPLAGTLWGDRNGTVPTGFLVRFVDGFSSPPHIHNATYVKLPAGYTGKIHSHGSTFRAVVIKGQLQYQLSETDIKTLAPGSYFSSKGDSVHQVSSKAGVESIIYVRTDGKYGVIPEQHRK